MFNKILKGLRVAKSLSQAELAGQLGVSTSTIGMYERGMRTPDNETLIKIANFFDVTIDYLLLGEDKCESNEGDLDDYLNQIHKDPNLRLLFSLTKNATKEDIEKIVMMVKVIKGE